MRIDSLHLLAFGAFTNSVIDLSRGSAGLHIIYGPNESGKSTSLRALRQVLYGIPAKSSDNFKHAHPDMRIGAVLRHSDGSVLRILRRKGNTKTLRMLDAESELIDQSALQHFLGNVNQTTFENMFGIDHPTLVSGGEAILQGNGELGKLLFSAGAGITDLRSVFAGLEKDFQEFYTRNGASRIINKQLSEYAEAKRRLKESELPNSQWEQHNLALLQAVQKKETLDKKILACQKQVAKMRRLLDAIPICAEREHYFSQLQELAETVLLPDNFQDEARKLLEQNLLLQRENEHDSRKLSVLIAELEQLQVPEGILERSSTIENLQQRLGSHQKAAVDRLSLQQSLIEEQERARCCLLDLGRKDDFEAASHLRMSVQEKSRLRKLALERRALWQAYSDAQALRQRTEQRLKQCSLDLVQLEQLPACEKLLISYKRIQSDPQIEERTQLESSKLERSFRQFLFDLRKFQLKDWPEQAQLSDAVDLHARLHALLIPDMQVIDEFDKKLVQTNKEIESLKSRIAEQKQEQSACQSRLQEHELKIAAPTEDDLKSSRTWRNRAWKLVLKSWKEGKEESSEFDALMQETGAATADLAAAYELGVNRADTVADRLRHEADHVAQKVQLNAQLKQLNVNLKDLEEKLSDRETRYTNLRAEWDRHFQNISDKQISPSAAKVYVAQFEVLRNSFSQILETSDLVESSRMQIRKSKEELRVALLEAKSSPGASEQSLLNLLEQAQQSLEKQRSMKQAQAELEKELSRLQIDLLNNTVTEQTRKTELDAWAANWQPAVEGLGLCATTSPEELTAFLDRLDQFFSHYDQIANFKRRIGGIDRDAELFESDVQQTAARLNLAGLNVEEAASTLLAMLKKANEMEQRRVLLQEQKQDLQESNESRSLALARLKDRFSQMIKEAAVSSEEELLDAAKKSQQRKGLVEILDNYNRQLLRLGEGRDLDDFIVECKSNQADDLSLQLNSIEQEIAQAESEREEIQAKIGAEKQVLLGMDGSAAAAENAARLQQILAELGQDVEQFGRLKIASIILQQAIDRYRQKNQSPILQKASDIFARLSNGSFAGLQEDFNEKGEPLLYGLRAAGNTLVPIEGMSDGSCDQVYLALRLAGLLLYLEKEEPLPFIVDDILVNFDDQRSLATLRVLSEISKRTQVIMFTHHSHIVELARKNLDAGQTFISGLPGAELEICDQEMAFSPGGIGSYIDAAF